MAAIHLEVWLKMHLNWEKVAVCWVWVACSLIISPCSSVKSELELSKLAKKVLFSVWVIITVMPTRRGDVGHGPMCLGCVIYKFSPGQDWRDRWCGACSCVGYGFFFLGFWVLC